MKRYLLGIVFLAGCGGKMFQPPTTTPSKIGVSWGYESTNECQPNTYHLYRINGICPQTLENSENWKELTVTTSSCTYTDTNVTSGSTYSYDVEAELASRFSGPSNCITKTAP